MKIKPGRFPGSAPFDKSGKSIVFPSLSYQTRSSTVRCNSVGSGRINVLFIHDNVRPNYAENLFIHVSIRHFFSIFLPLKSPTLTPLKATTGFDDPSNSSA